MIYNVDHCRGAETQKMECQMTKLNVQINVKKTKLDTF
jgi:hypothetical protein